LRLRLRQLGLRHLEGGFTSLKLGRTNEVLRLQLLVALEISPRQVTVGLRGHHLCARRLGGECKVLRVKLGQQLPGLDALAHLCRSVNQLATHAKPKSGFHPGLHLTRVLKRALRGGDTYRHQLDRTNWLGLRGRFAARHHEQRSRYSHRNAVGPNTQNN
jgi:hypothetical protein